MASTSSRRVRVVVLGSANTDLVLTCSELPKPGETQLGGVFRQAAGGKGANQAVAAARAGARVAFIGAVGDDAYGKEQRAGLKKEGFDLRYFRTLRGVNSGIALILLGGRDRQNLIGVASSANDRVTADQVRAAEPAIKQAGCLVAQLEIPMPAILAAAVVARRNGVPFILNPAPARALPASLLPLVDCLVPNEHEAALLTNGMAPEAAAHDLIKRGCRAVIVTLGSKGALLVTPQICLKIPAPKVKPVDTVGAGDCLCGWLAAGVAEMLPWKSNLQRAIRAASISVTNCGAQESMPLRRLVSSR
jgi:ribokinase